MSSLVDAAAALSVSDERPDSFDAEPGVHIKLDKRGAGAAPVEGDTVQVNYAGRVKGKKQNFDENSGGYPFEFTLGEQKVLPGWELALPKLRVSDQATLTLASEFGYGEAGDSDDIPPNATLIFTVELVGIKDSNKGAAPGESDRERLAKLRADREVAAAEAKAKKEATAAAGAEKQRLLKEKLANKGEKGQKGGGKKKEKPPKGKTPDT